MRVAWYSPRYDHHCSVGFPQPLYKAWKSKTISSHLILFMRRGVVDRHVRARVDIASMLIDSEQAGEITLVGNLN
jgi:hypothetical protein